MSLSLIYSNQTGKTGNDVRWVLSTFALWGGTYFNPYLIEQKRASENLMCHHQVWELTSGGARLPGQVSPCLTVWGLCVWSCEKHQTLGDWHSTVTWHFQVGILGVSDNLVLSPASLCLRPLTRVSSSSSASRRLQALWNPSTGTARRLTNRKTQLQNPD